MESIEKLKNADVIEINGEKFQVIMNTSLRYNEDKDELEYMIKLVKHGGGKLTADFMLTYFSKRPHMPKFFVFSKKTWLEKKIKAISF